MSYSDRYVVLAEVENIRGSIDARRDLATAGRVFGTLLSLASCVNAWKPDNLALGLVLVVFGVGALIESALLDKSADRIAVRLRHWLDVDTTLSQLQSTDPALLARLFGTEET